jgi:hypothetical protein
MKYGLKKDNLKHNLLSYFKAFALNHHRSLNNLRTKQIKKENNPVKRIFIG